MNHSPLPWTCPHTFQSDEDTALLLSVGRKPVQALTNDGQRMIKDANGNRVALADPVAQFKRGTGHQVECAERDANAALIVRAVNCHQQLIGALEDVLTQFEIILPLHGVVHDERQAIINARAALARAKGEV